jgi:hypothetical protein
MTQTHGKRNSFNNLCMEIDSLINQVDSITSSIDKEITTQQENGVGRIATTPKCEAQERIKTRTRSYTTGGIITSLVYS